MSSAPEESTCIFCQIVAGEIPSRKVYETDSLMAFHDVAPKAPTHILVIPKKHIARLAEVTDEDADLLSQMLLAARDVARQEGFSENFRLIMNNGADSGQTVFHLHMHLLAGRKMSWPPG